MDKIKLANVLLIIVLVMVLALVVIHFIKKDYVVSDGTNTVIKSGYFGKAPNGTVKENPEKGK